MVVPGLEGANGKRGKAWLTYTKPQECTKYPGRLGRDGGRDSQKCHRQTVPNGIFQPAWERCRQERATAHGLKVWCRWKGRERGCARQVYYLPSLAAKDQGTETLGRGPEAIPCAPGKGYWKRDGKCDRSLRVDKISSLPRPGVQKAMVQDKGERVIRRTEAETSERTEEKPKTQDRASG